MSRARVASSLAMVAMFLFVLPAAGQTPPLHGPLGEPPLGVTMTMTGTPSDGLIGRSPGKTLGFEGVALAGLTNVYWAPLPDEVKLSFDGGTFESGEIMQWDDSQSDPGSGIIYWNGTTYLPGNPTLVYTQCLMHVTEPDSSTAIALLSPWTLGLDDEQGGVIPFPVGGKILVNLKMEASFSASGPFQPALDFYDENTHGPSGFAHSSFSWGWYWEGLAPTLVANNGLSTSEGGVALLTTAMLETTDLESPPEEITYTVGPDELSGPPVFGTLYLEGAPVPHGGTFTQTDLDSARVSYEHDGSETTVDSFQFSVMDGDSMLAADGEYTVFTFPMSIAPVNDPPTAYDDAFETGIAATLSDTLHATDPDSPSLICYFTETGNLGTASVLDPEAGTFQYEPFPESAGIDTLKFQATDGDLMSNEALIVVTIQNSPPVAVDGEGTTQEEVGLAGTLTGSDPDPQQLTFRIDTNGVKGDAVILDEIAGTFVYTPDAAAIGEDSFTFVVNDGFLDSDPATFRVTIRPNLDQGDLLIADAQGALVLVDPTTVQQAIVASHTDLSQVRGLDRERTGHLVAASSTRGVLRIDPVSGLTTVLSPIENFLAEPVGPFGIAVERGGTILVADGVAVYRVDPTNGSATVLSTGGALVVPVGVCVSAYSDAIFVADAGAFASQTSQIVELDPGSGAQTVVSSSGSLVMPIFLDLDPDGDLVVSDAASMGGGTDQILEIDPTYGTQQVVTSGGLLALPSGVCAIEGNIYVNSSAGSTLVRVDPQTGDQTAVMVGGHLTGPWGLTRVVSLATAVDPEPAIAHSFALHSAAPNPFRPSTTIRFDLPTPSSVSLRIYDVSGRLVRVLIDESTPAGRHSVVWNGDDQGRRAVAAGVYFLRLDTGDYVETRRVVRLP